jgi:hypothetical protein
LMLRWRHHIPSACQKLPSHQHSITSFAVRISNLDNEDKTEQRKANTVDWKNMFSLFISTHLNNINFNTRTKI